MSKRKGISKQDLKRVKELDLLTYFKNYEPDELKIVVGITQQEHILLYIYRMDYGAGGLKGLEVKRL